MKNKLIIFLLFSFFNHLAAQDVPPPAANLELIPSGSYVIPLDFEKQNVTIQNIFYGYTTVDVFNIKAYGLAAFLLKNNVEVKWVIRAGKQKDEADFTANANKILPIFEPAEDFDFIASAFVITNTDVAFCNPNASAQNFNLDSLILSFHESVAVYKLTNDEMLDVRYTLRNPPEIKILQDGGFSTALSQILDTALIDYVLLYNDDFINAPECNTIVCQPHISPFEVDASYTAALTSFVNAGGNLYAQCEGLVSFEEEGFYQTSGGFYTFNFAISSNLNIEYHNVDMPLMQFEGMVPDGVSGSTGTYAFNPGSTFAGNTYLQMTDGPASDEVFFCTVSDFNGADQGGNVMYLGGHEYGDFFFGYGSIDEGLQQTYQAKRIFLNSMFVPAKVSFACAGNDICICEGEEVTLGCDNLSQNLDVLWSSSIGSAICDTCLNPVISPTETATYTMTPQNNNCGNSEITVTVYEYPTYDNVTYNCIGNDFTVSFDVQTTGDPYLISGNDGSFNGATFTSDLLASATNFSFEIGDEGLCRILVEDSHTCGCSLNANISGNEIICLEDNEQAKINIDIEGGTGNYTFTYAQNGEAQNPITTNSTSFELEIDESASYTLISITDGNCVGTVDGLATVELVEEPDANILPLSAICSNEGIIEIEVMEDGGLMEGLGTSYENDKYFFDPEITGEGTFPIAYSFEGICPVERTFNVEVKYCVEKCKFYAPNVFSPNNDDSNEYWNIESNCEFETFDLFIYNRWGEQVFHTKDKNDYWDGTYHGKLLNSGVFVYVVNATTRMDAEDLDYYKKGNITLLR